jgi:YD repeat-containing protein
LSYSGGHLTNVTDDNGRLVGYGYAAAGNLAGYSDPLSSLTTFAYDGSGRLTQIFYPTEPDAPFVTNAYDPLGRVYQQQNANVGPRPSTLRGRAASWSMRRATATSPTRPPAGG